MLIVRLEQEDWNRVLAVLAQAPWNVANPLIMAIGEQLRAQAPRPNGPDENRPTDPSVEWAKAKSQ